MLHYGGYTVSNAWYTLDVGVEEEDVKGYELLNAYMGVFQVYDAGNCCFVHGWSNDKPWNNDVGWNND